MKRLTWMYHVVHNTCKTHGINIKTQYIGLTSILLSRKGCSSIRLDQKQLFFKKHLQLSVFRKLRGWKLEKSYEKAHMSPRPPPKISLRHDWSKDLGSKVDRQPAGEIARQPGGEVARLAKFFQPAQPIPNPIRDRSGQLGIKQDVISVQACSSEDSKSLNVEQTHDRSGWPGKDTVKTTLKYIMRPKRWTLTMKQFVKELMRTWTSKFQDCHILLRGTRKVPAFENWFRRLRTTQIDMLFKKFYNRINHVIPSVQNQNK